MSLSMRFLQQYLTAMKIPSSTKMMPQAPPIAAARMLISDRDTRKKGLGVKGQLSQTQTELNILESCRETTTTEKGGKIREKETTLCPNLC